jgi:hypothetical protein
MMHMAARAERHGCPRDQPAWSSLIIRLWLAYPAALPGGRNEAIELSIRNYLTHTRQPTLSFRPQLPHDGAVLRPTGRRPAASVSQACQARDDSDSEGQRPLRRLSPQSAIAAVTVRMGCGWRSCNNGLALFVCGRSRGEAGRSEQAHAAKP